MNYAGKFDAAISLDGQGSRSPAYSHVDSFTAKAHGHIPDGAFVVPDPNLIFNADFKRAGLDLVLSHEGHEFVVHDYFRADKRAAIASPDGAHLTGDVVNALTGHVQYAQAAGGIATAQVIGHVTKLSGSATAVRNGVSVILNNGDNVEKGDVVSTGGDSTLGITFIDGTVFGLSSNARMVLNEMVYDPNGSSNSSLLSLVAGTITFVAGETAKHGDMKIDTPVATMGIRGTAVLTQINFVVPAGGGDPQPQASFQVLVEPNGTTGSYILFDKVTLLPIATVNQAGQMIQISGGNVSITNALMSPDIQKLITDVFTLKFTDNNTNTKLTTNFTDTITPTSDGLMFKTQAGYSATAVFTNLNQPGSDGPGHNPATSTRIPGPPDARSLDANGNVKTAFAVTEHANATGDHADGTGDTVPSDTVSGLITFVDQNLGDQPSVSISLGDAPNYVYKNAGQQDVTGSLTALQKQDIAATQIDIQVVANAGNNNNGSAIWTYTIPDHVFDFLAAGETLTLTYKVRVNNNFSVNPESSYIDITITITGTNDKPVITTSVPIITFEGGTSVPGGPLTSDVATSGTLSFDDVDLTDKHTVKVALTSATLPDGTVPPGPLAAFQSAMSVAIAAGADSTGDGTGTINWSLADLPVYLADFIPKGEVLTLVYTVTLTDSQGATSQQTITVTITGTDAPAVVWIATDKPGVPSGGFWKDAGNWATGTVPTINDDVIVITDQLHGLTPSYPVTIDTAAYAKSITMNDFGGPPPKVIVQASLTISGALNMGADSILTNTVNGTMSVGGKAEILGTSVLTNAGWLTLAGGSDFASGTTITNSGVIELSGGTLKTLATIHNAGGTLRNEAGTTLIVDTATVDGGTVMILGTLELDGTSLIENGALNNFGTVNVKGTAEFAHETVSNDSAGTIRVLANGWLTVDEDSSVTNNGAVTVDANGKLTVNGATISGGAFVLLPGTTVPGGGAASEGGSVLVLTGLPTVGTITNNGELDLTGSAILTSGILKNNASLNVSGTGNALDSETVTNAGTIEVLANGALAIDQGSTVANSAGNVIVDDNAALTLSHATISGGAIKGAGTIDVAGASKIDGGATVSISTITADAALTLDSVTVSGTVITDNASVTLANTVKLKDGATIEGASVVSKGAITNTGTLEIAGAATLLNDVVTNTGAVTVAGSQTLTLDGTEITGGTVNGAGTIDVAGASKIDGGATLSTSAIIADAALTLDGVTVSGSTITDKSSITLANTVTLKDSATIQGASAASKGAITNNGTLQIAGAATLLNDIVTNTGTVTVTGNQTLTLDGTEVTGGTVNGAGTINVAGASKIDGDATLSTNAVIANAALTLDGVTVSGSTITDNSSVTLANTVTLKDGATIQGASAASKGAITNNGTLQVAGAATLLNDIVTNTGTMTVAGSQTLTLDGTEITGGTVNGAGTIDVAGASKIDGGATLSTSAIIANAALTLDGVTVSGSTITDNSSVTLANTVTLKDSAKIQGTSAASRGAITNSGTLEIAGAAMLLNDIVTNTGTMTVDDSQTLTLYGTDITGGTINNYDGPLGGTIHVTGNSAINGNAALNKGAVTVDNGVTLTFGDATIAGTSITNHGTVGVEASKKTTLNGATLTGGTLTVSGTLESTGTSLIDSADITNTGTITVTDGTLTIDPATLHTITNSSLIQASGGTLDISYEDISNSADLKAINSGTLKLAHLTVSNTVTGAVTVGGSSKLYLTDVSINGGSLSNAGNLYSVSGVNTVTGGVTNTGGTIEVQGGTLNLSGGISGQGALTIDDGAKLELGGADAQTVTFAGGTSTLQLDKVAGQSFTGTIAAQTSTDGTFAVTGTADITTSAGDALDFSVSKTAHASVVLTPTGVLTGAANGVVVTQNGAGDISLTATKDIVGLAGNGIMLRDSTTGTGGITVNNLTGKATGTGTDSVGILVENLNTANAGNISITQLGGAAGGAFGIDAMTAGSGNVGIDAGGNITGIATYGIRARSYGNGDVTVTTETGSVVTSGSSGIVAVNRASSLDAPSDSTITVNSYGTINSGSSANIAGNLPGGIEAGYTGATSGTDPNTSVNGTVVVNNHGNINAAAGYGINAYNYGNGDVTVTSFAGTTITTAGTQSVGINAVALSGGTGDVTVTLGANVTISGATSYGIRAYSVDAGDITVTMAAGDSVTSGSSGIVAVNFATTIADAVGSTISVEAHGNIHSGTTPNQDSTTPGAIIAGYKPGGDAAFSNAVNGDVTVTVASDATIIADAGYGIDAFTWGIGDVTVTTGLLSSITATTGTAIGAFSHGGGDVSVTNDGSATGTVGLSAVAAGAGDVTIVNHGNITGTSLAGISVTQNDSDAAGDPVATGSTHITNSGSVVGATGHAAIFIAENTTGSATIDNTGTIGPALAGNVTSTTYAIVETGGAVTINNTGAIDGNISVAHATFNNNAGGTWTVAGSGVFGNASTIINHGAIDLHGASISGTGLNISNFTEINSYGTASISGTITNTGTIEVHDGALTLFGSLSGTGTVTVDTGALLKLDGSVAVTQTINLDGDGAHLQIDTSSFGGTIGELSKTDTIELSTIKFGLHTTAVYQANAIASTGGTLTVTGDDGQTIVLKLTGADYSGMHFAGANDGTGHTLITINENDGAPAIEAGATLTATVDERDTTTGSTAHDPSPNAATGAIDFKDVDLTDRPTAEITQQSVTWLDTNGISHLPLSGQETALEQALTLLPQANTNNGTVTWNYSVVDSALDFLGEGQTAKVVSTITLDDHHGQTTMKDVTITLTGKNDAPVVEVKAANDSAGATLGETNAGLDTTGKLTLSDADATDHVSVARDSHVAVNFQGTLQADGFDGLWASDLKNYFSVSSGDILNGTSDHAQFTWEFNSGSQAFDFLAAGQTLSLQYTIVPDDGHTATGTGNGVVTITIAGSNDAPTLADATLASVAGDNSNPSGAAISDVFHDKFADVDATSSFKAIAVTSDSATADQGVWQYELAGTDQWVDIGSVSDTHALVLGTDTLIRFVPADGFAGTPTSLGVHAIDNTYTGDVTTDVLTPTTIDLTATGTGGTTPISDKLTIIDTQVTAPESPPASGPVINTDSFHVEHLREGSVTEVITDLVVTDTDAGAATDAFTVEVSTTHPDTSSASVSPTSGTLDQINTGLAEGYGISYEPTGASTEDYPVPPDTDQITVTVTDTTTSLFDTVNFIFVEGANSQGITLTGTVGKDVIFATESSDTLIGGGAKDQFVFAPASSQDTVQHSVNDFELGLDKIDLRQFGSISAVSDLSATQQNSDTLLTLDNHETILLKGVAAQNLQASDFIFGTHIT